MVHHIDTGATLERRRSAWLHESHEERRGVETSGSASVDLPSYPTRGVFAVSVVVVRC